MRQYQAIEKISKKVIDDNLCQAILLKGSLARETEDEYSDVDLYLIASENNLENVLIKRIEYLNSYLPIMYHTFVSHNNQVICVYDDGLHVDLYVTTLNKLSRSDDIAIVYDPNHLLSNYVKVPLMFSPNEIGELINSFLFTSLDFYRAYKRKDFIYSFRVANHMSAILGTFLRTYFDPDFAKLGLKGFLEKVDAETKKKYYEILKKMKIDTVLESVKMMFVLFEGYMIKLPLKIAEHVNFDFFIYAKKKIMSIDE